MDAHCHEDSLNKHSPLKAQPSLQPRGVCGQSYMNNNHSPLQNRRSDSALSSSLTSISKRKGCVVKLDGCRFTIGMLQYINHHWWPSMNRVSMHPHCCFVYFCDHSIYFKLHRKTILSQFLAVNPTYDLLLNFQVSKLVTVQRLLDV